MKTKYTSLLVASALMAVSFSSTQAVAANEGLAQSLCEYIAIDDKNRMRSTLKQSRVKIRNVFDAVQCNGSNMLRHAMVSGANDIGEYIVKSIPRSSLQDGSELSWAESNGYSGTVVYEALKERSSS